MFFKEFVSVKRKKIKKGASQTYDTPSITLVCYEKFERNETSQFQSCFTKHDFIEKA